jgi:hypothetical protein
MDRGWTLFDRGELAIKELTRIVERRLSMRQGLAKLMLGRQSVRRKLCQKLVKSLRLLPYELRLEHDAIARPHYGYCLLQAAKLAKKLGHTEISVLEFGVAGGNGLLNLEMHAREIKKLLNVDIQIYGFDTGCGLPPPVDYRDLPYHWKPGFFSMNGEKLRSRLTLSELVIGDVADTVASFVQRYNPAPIGALLMDLDYYSSTKYALTLFDLHRTRVLPRVFTYFDDVIGDDTSLYNEHTGALLAINEFNSAHATQKLCRADYLTTRSYPETWYHQIFIYHDFVADAYNQFVSEENQQLPLKDELQGV